ncbi:MAG: ATP-binding cassette domain-containing protein [Solirubrobacterales bacterium]|nr:ATP-binding cassette domain-containing protein [Solirubrobacterales bacterium]
MAIEDLSGALATGPNDPDDGSVIRARRVEVFRWSVALGQRVTLLHGVEWRVDPGEHWAVMGPNGAGKTTLLRLAAAESHPSEGVVEVLGRRLGATDMRALRERIGLVDSRTAQTIPSRRPVLETILSGAFNSIAIQRRRLNESHRERAGQLAELVGLRELLTRGFGDCSQGERQRVLLARALMPEPRLLLLDEAAAGLDLPSREQLISALGEMARQDPGLTTVAVTHHIEEIPPTTTHALLLRDARVLAAGPIGETLTSEAVSACFDLPIEVTERAGRFTATIHPI